MEYIDDEALVAKTKSEDDDKEDEEHSPKASVEHPIVEHTYATQKLINKTNEMLLKAFENGMFLTEETKFLLDNHFETMGTSKIFPVYYQHGSDRPKHNTFVAVVRPIAVAGKLFEGTNG